MGYNRLDHVRSWLRFALPRWSAGVGRILHPLEPNPAAQIDITIRYSVILDNGRFWKLGKTQSAEDYRAALFSRQRLEQRLGMLERIALPSLAGQTLAPERGLRDVTLLVSTELPAWHHDQLLAVTGRYPWVRILALPPETPRVPDLPAVLMASVRLDDDDALSRDLLARVSSYTRPDHVGRTVTFANGHLGILRPDFVFESFGPYRRPKVSAGLTYVCGPRSAFRSVYHLGGHPFVQHAAPLVVDDGPPAFVRTIHASNDYRGSRTGIRVRGTDPADIAARFAIARAAALASGEDEEGVPTPAAE